MSLNLNFTDSGSGDFPQCPVGLVTAVLADIVDVGLEKDWHNKIDPEAVIPKIALVFQTEEVDPKGDGNLQRMFLIKKTRRSAKTNSNLYKWLMAIMGGKVAEEAVNEDGSFNTSALIGFNANLVIDTYEGKSYIKDVTPVKAKDRHLLEVEDYDHDKFFKEKE